MILKIMLQLQEPEEHHAQDTAGVNSAEDAQNDPTKVTVHQHLYLSCNAERHDGCQHALSSGHMLYDFTQSADC